MDFVQDTYFINCDHTFKGHGVENAIDTKTSTKEKTGKKLDTSEPIGDCMVGSKGKLYSAHDLRHDLLGYHPGKAVATLDCCRDSNKRGASNLLSLLGWMFILCPTYKFTKVFF